MPTNLAPDDDLIDRNKTRKEAATASLAEDLQRREQLRILEWAGAIDYDPDYDYKALRRRKSR